MHSDRPVAERVSWLIVLAGWLAMFGPTYWNLSQTLWQTEEQGHGALILIVVLWLLWDRRHLLLGGPYAPRVLAGWVSFALGVMLYIVGRSQDIWIFEIGAQIPVLAAVLLLQHGASAVRAAWFPLLYFVFMIPLPGILVDALTTPLKQWVSVLAENVLYAAGYPIGRSGVMLTIGQYQLLVADACSGLHSLFSLSALGLLYLYLMARKSWLHNGIMLACILPIAFGANVIRVIALVLITYHLGDAAGQGFLHGFAGIALLIAALLGLFVLDGLLLKVVRPLR